MVNIQKDLAWLEGFLWEVGHLYPKDRLISIRGFKIRHGHMERLDGQIHNSAKKYKITIRTHNQRSGGLYDVRTMYGILTTLAHELAHMTNWEHTPEHLMRESRILLCFAYRLKDLGIKDSHKPRLEIVA